ncbi:hypothetical protein ACLWBD_07710 [Bdellovibrio sp. HCB117]|uniref:hypothetical protein n=1 Tax=Bdellovibrio sp. HCB117 TaxID=3394359 RepID=UPI0039B5C4B0
MKLKETPNGPITLQAMIDVNSAFNSILKESYRRLSRKEEGARTPEFKIYVNEVKEGSIIELLSLDIVDLPKIAGQTAFAFTHFNPEDVFKVAQNSIQFLIDLAKARKSGKEISVHVEEGSLAFVNIGNGTMKVGDVVFETARSITPAAKMLSRPVRSGHLEYVQMGSEDMTISVNASNADSFSDVIEVEEVAKEIIGNIIGFNKNTRMGTVKFIENLTERTLKFELTTKSFLIDTIEFMKHKQCRLLCHEEYIPGPDGQKTVVGLQVFKVKEI